MRFQFVSFFFPEFFVLFCFKLVLVGDSRAVKSRAWIGNASSLAWPVVRRSAVLDRQVVLAEQVVVVEQ